MAADRYLKAVLTIIAIELGWIAMTHTAAPVRAQAEATPVVITGIDLRQRPGFLPVAVLGQMRVPAGVTEAFRPLDTNATIRNETLKVSAPQPLDVRTVNAIKIDTERPLRVENVGYAPAQRPGE